MQVYRQFNTCKRHIVMCWQSASQDVKRCVADTNLFALEDPDPALNYLDF